MAKMAFLIILNLCFASLAMGQSFAVSNKALITNPNSRGPIKAYRMVPWQWQKPGCDMCPIKIVIKGSLQKNKKVREFVKTIETHKFELLTLYQSDSQEYNLLARMAVGILGRESLFFESTRYYYKENFPEVISIFKFLDSMFVYGTFRVSPNSRGPTQIKMIPEMIKSEYGFDESELYVPKNAALATMGYLIEALAELKRRIRLNKLTFINKNNYVDYLPYIYFGSKNMLLNRKATPDKNIYIIDMKRYMKLASIYEVHANKH
jgi:hypothetical protein